MFEIGINTYCECGKNPIDIFKNIKKCGFKNVMVADRYESLEDNIKHALKFGLNIPFAHLSADKSNSLWAVGEKKDNYVNYLLKEIDTCSKYCVPVAIIHATDGDPGIKVIEPSNHVLETMNTIIEYAKSKNVKIAIENVDALSFEHFSFLLDNINSSNFGFCYDIGHHQLFNPNFDIVKKYGDRILAIHLHDNLMDWKYGIDSTRDLHMIPFDGKIDYNKILKELAKTNYNNVIMLEVHKIGPGEPRVYKDISNIDFLSRAINNARKCCEIIEKYKI